MNRYEIRRAAQRVGLVLPPSALTGPRPYNRISGRLKFCSRALFLEMRRLPS